MGKRITRVALLIICVLFMSVMSNNSTSYASAGCNHNIVETSYFEDRYITASHACPGSYWEIHQPRTTYQYICTKCGFEVPDSRRVEVCTMYVWEREYWYHFMCCNGKHTPKPSNAFMGIRG